MVTCASCAFTVPTTTSLPIPVTVTDASVVVAPSAGESMVICGGVVSSVTCAVVVPVTPFAFVAMALKTFRPSTSGTGIEKIPALCGARIPLIFRLAPGSLIVPLTVTGVRFVTLRFEGDVIVTSGAGA